MIITLDAALEIALTAISKKISMGHQFTADLLLKESLSVPLNGIEQGLLDMKNDKVTQAGNVVKSAHYTSHFNKHQNNTQAINELNSIIDLLSTQQTIPEKYSDQELNSNTGMLRELQLKHHGLVLFYTLSQNGYVNLIDFGEYSEIFNR